MWQPASLILVEARYIDDCDSERLDIFPISSYSAEQPTFRKDALLRLKLPLSEHFEQVGEIYEIENLSESQIDERTAGSCPYLREQRETNNEK